MKSYKNGAILTTLVVMMIAGTASGSAFAATGMSIMLEIDGSKVVASGQTASSTPVTIQVIDPIGNRAEVAQATPNPDLMYTVTLSGQGWQKDGVYTVSAFQTQTSTASAKIEVSSGEVARVFDFENSLSAKKMDEMMVDEKQETVMKDEGGLVLTDASQEGATMVMITGTTDKSESITVQAQAPNGNRVSIDQITPNSDGTFTIEMQIGGELGKQDGMYTISAQQGSGAQYKDEVMVEIVDYAVIPEFGSAAIIVLVVAIVSIVAITSRSRLTV